MRRYILRRLLLILPTLLGVAVLVFLLLRVVPGDIVEMRFAEGSSSMLSWSPRNVPGSVWTAPVASVPGVAVGDGASGFWPLHVVGQSHCP
jgi:ABC-type microcin C transport system permease subunit YejB